MDEEKMLKAQRTSMLREQKRSGKKYAVQVIKVAIRDFVKDDGNEYRRMLHSVFVRLLEEFK